jgi:tRNA (mo5U34)-methyltransferase
MLCGLMDPAHPPYVMRLKAAERSLREQRAALLEAVRQDPAVQSEGITLYDFDSLDNFVPIIGLLDEHMAAHLDGLPNRTMIDIGCANGELGFAFEEAGYSVALLDKSHVAEAQGSLVLQNAPLIASIIARRKGSRAVIFDENLDDGFDPRRVIDGFSRSRQGDERFERFGLGVMLGVLYHLRNPYLAIERLGQLCDHLIVGTWVMDCLPDRRRIVEDDQVVFLLEDRQLADDPTNYWIFTPRSFRVLVERCGWRVLAEHTMTNPLDGEAARPRRRWERWLGRRQPSGVSPPEAVKRRMFMLLERAPTVAAVPADR